MRRTLMWPVQFIGLTDQVCSIELLLPFEIMRAIAMSIVKHTMESP
jgi:hypothetical protein